jgi:hypothetical protein
MTDPRDRSSGQFLPGVTGNPKGRPKKTRTVDASVLEALGERVTVTENGRRRRISKLQVSAKSLANKSATGDVIATRLALDLAQKAETRLGEATTRTPVMTASDHEIAERVVARLRLLIAQEGNTSS